MYALIINGIECEFDGVISIVKNNPIFSDEISYSLQFSLSAQSEINRRAHEFIDMPNTSNNQEKELPCVISVGIIQLIGTVTSKFQNGSFVDYFKESGEFYKAVKEKKLSEIPFDIDEFNLWYADFREGIIQYRINDNVNRPCSFPYYINTRVNDKMAVKINFNKVVNYIPADSWPIHYPVIPLFHIHYIFRELFQKHGMELQDNVFTRYQFLKRLVYANNYLVNEFSIDRTVVSEVSQLIGKIEASKDPVVTCSAAHGLPNWALIQIKNVIPQLNNRILQIELVDATSFKILGEDFSEGQDIVMQYHVSSVEFIPGGAPKYILTLDENLFQDFKYDGVQLEFSTFKLASNYANGNKTFNRVFEDNVLQKNKLEYISNVPNEEDRSTDWENATLYYLGWPSSEYMGVLQKLNPIDCRFYKMNPANYMPDLKISEFITDFESLGIFAFVNNNTAELHHIKDIINSSESIDISSFTEEIRDVDNTGAAGFTMKMTADSSDEFAKEMQPVTSIDPKYNKKDAVITKADLPYAGSETNDVRLVTSEKSWYVFNKSFLNADNNWKFLCYDILDKTEGDGLLSISPKFSPAIKDKETNYARMDVPCNCNTLFDATLKNNSRLLLFYNRNNVPFATSDIYDTAGNLIQDAELAIRWDTDKGIHQVLMKEYLELQTKVRKDCVALTHWPAQHLANFRFNKKYRNKGVEYLVKSIKYGIDFKNKQIDLNDTELVKV